jgi:hypothetical protein
MSVTLADEQLAFVRRLSEFGVAYAPVGGFALRAHGHDRAANDLDLLSLPTEPNTRVKAARIERRRSFACSLSDRVERHQSNRS